MPSDSDSSVLPMQYRLQEAGRRLSVATIAFHRSLAAQLGLNDTDHKCLDLLLREGPMSAGDLAARGGYTTGAVTGIVNRLAARGLVARTTDASDARRVTLSANAEETRRRMGPLMAPFIADMSALHQRYSPEQLELLHGFMAASSEMLERHAARLREQG